MKRLFLTLLMSGSLLGFAQLKNEKPMVKQLQSSSTKGSSKAVIVENVPLAHTVQLFPLDKSGKIIGKGNISKQVKQIFKNIAFVLNEADSGIDNIVKLMFTLPGTDLSQRLKNKLAAN